MTILSWGNWSTYRMCQEKLQPKTKCKIIDNGTINWAHLSNETLKNFAPGGTPMANLEPLNIMDEWYQPLNIMGEWYHIERKPTRSLPSWNMDFSRKKHSCFKLRTTRIPYNCHFFYTDTIFVRIKFTPKNADFSR